VNFLLPLRRETAAINALLPLVLKQSCREYPDMTVLNKRLKQLYGARIDGDVAKIGEVQAVTLFSSSLGDSFTFSNEQILLQCAKLLRDVIFDPAFENGTFKNQCVEIEKHNLLNQIDSLLNDKRQYASMRLREEMCPDESYGVGKYGKREDVNSITPQRLYEAWENMLKTARVEILFLGSGDTEHVKQLFADAFGRIERSPVDISTRVIKSVSGVKTVTDKMPVTQAKLVMGFRTTMSAPENTDAMQVACTILGGTPQSKLFAVIREKMGLCYYCLSYFERLKGIVIIDSGIEQQNYEKARAGILEQLDELKNGNFSDDDIKFAKLSLQNSYKQLSDSLESLAAYYLRQFLYGSARSPEMSAAGIMGVSRENIINAARGIQLDTVYLLAGEQEGRQ
jgi:predicted Zn-dependent peptidase